MSIKLRPIAGTQNRVIIEPYPKETVTASGIIIPDSAQEKPQRGKVISISPKDEKGNVPDVKAGETVYYGKYAGTEIVSEGREYLIMRESDILVAES